MSSQTKRFHIHVGVKDLEASVQFYSTLFGVQPAKLKSDYAKWILEDPRLNFAISTKSNVVGIDHVGIQVDMDTELSNISDRLIEAGNKLKDVGETTCCYSRSNKAWVNDPNGLAWEVYKNMIDVEVYSEKNQSIESEDECCASDSQDLNTSCC